MVKNNNTLIKYNAVGDSVNFFNEVRKGKITQIDATNPLRILLFYADYNQIVILDNMLSKKNTIKLNSIGVYNVPCIANSIDGGIWIFDVANNSLLKINEDLKITSNTALQTTLQETINPNFMVEQERNLYIVDSAQAIYKFDLYGFYNTSYRFKATEIQCFASSIFYFQSPFLYSYNTQLVTENKLQIPVAEKIKQVRIIRNKIITLSENAFTFYDLKNSN